MPFGTDLSEGLSKISALINVGEWKGRDERARVVDQEHLDLRLTQLESNLESNLSRVDKALGLGHR
jgi:hypothetical protein